MICAKLPAATTNDDADAVMRSAAGEHRCMLNWERTPQDLFLQGDQDAALALLAIIGLSDELCAGGRKA